jgi:CBS domain containing-hemolysin-like protein
MNLLKNFKFWWKEKKDNPHHSTESLSPHTFSEGDQQKIALMQNILPLFELPVQEIMTPRADIDWIDLEQPIAKVHKYVLKSSHNTFPVCRHDLDKVAGKISLKKVLLSEENLQKVKLEKHIDPVLFVSPSLSCTDLIFKMKQSKNYMAIVVDEFGGVDGLVTLSDISEKVVGEVDLDQLSEVSPVIIHKDHTLTVDGRMTVEDLMRELPGLSLQDKANSADTIGGLVSTLAGHIPARGELIKHGSGLVFEVLACDARRIKKLRLHHVDEAKK